MAIYSILTYGEEFLRGVAKPVERLTPELKAIIQSMGATMYQSRGIGLAAPQVGLDIRLLVLDVDYVREDKNEKNTLPNLQVFINPEIIWESNDDSPFKEGCLSVPGLEAEVYRPKKIRLKFKTRDFQEREIQADGLLARVLQHEIDHLNGILFVDRLSKTKRLTLAGKLNRLKSHTLTKATISKNLL